MFEWSLIDESVGDDGRKTLAGPDSIEKSENRECSVMEERSSMTKEVANDEGESAVFSMSIHLSPNDEVGEARVPEDGLYAGRASSASKVRASFGGLGCLRGLSEYTKLRTKTMQAYTNCICGPFLKSGLGLNPRQVLIQRKARA